MHPALAWLQAELEHVQGIESALRVEDFVVSRETLTRMGLKPPVAEEAVLVAEEPDGLSVAVYLAPRVLESLQKAGRNPGSLFRRGLPTLCLAIEGVSHFLYLTRRAGERGQVSLLELEVQAEIDKFALSCLHLWLDGRRHQARELWRRLFEDVDYLPHLPAEELERYRTANQLAKGYCQALLRYVEEGRVEALLAELRHCYRLGAGEKYARLHSTAH